MRLVRTAKAIQDIENCLYWSAENFGVSAAQRYRALLEVALLAILQVPERAGSKVVDGIAGNVRFYHIKHSRKDAPVAGLIVKKLRHIIVYCTDGANSMVLLRVLHDGMDFDTQLG